MFGWDRRKRRKKEKGSAADGLDAVSDLGDVAEAGCGCDLPLIALTIMAGASLLYLVR